MLALALYTSKMGMHKSCNRLSIHLPLSDSYGGTVDFVFSCWTSHAPPMPQILVWTKLNGCRPPLDFPYNDLHPSHMSSCSTLPKPKHNTPKYPENHNSTNDLDNTDQGGIDTPTTPFCLVVHDP